MENLRFRLKVDLSKFFHDARQSCWIFIDGTKIKNIYQIQLHISKLFNIKDQFHLLLNSMEYLPPMEDVRILRENETVLVVPGSGIKNSSMCSLLNDIYKDYTEKETCNDTKHIKEVSNDVNEPKTSLLTTRDETTTSDSTANTMQPVSINNSVDMTFHTVIDDTEADTDSKNCSNITQNCNTDTSAHIIPKRKRVRSRRKPLKNKSLSMLSLDKNEENKSKKPKIVDSLVIPSSKHIRFDDTEEDENAIACRIMQEISDQYIIKSNESYLNKDSSSDNLSALISLRQSSTPITFAKKMKTEVKMEKLSEDESSSINLNKTKENTNDTERNVHSKETDKEIPCLINKDLNIDLQNIPIMTRMPQVGDTIAFKTLKLGTDYSPQVSNFIIGKIQSYNTQGAIYVIKILEGKNEISMPSGKFSLSEDETILKSYTDKITLTLIEIKEPRLLM